MKLFNVNNDHELRRIRADLVLAYNIWSHRYKY